MVSNEKRANDLEIKVAALEAADTLAESLDENTRALNRVKRRYRLTMTLIVLVVITMLSAARINYDGHVRRCEASNQLRQEVEYKFHTIAESLKENGLSDQPGGEELLDILYTEIPLVDCSDIDWLGR